MTSFAASERPSNSRWQRVPVVVSFLCVSALLFLVSSSSTANNNNGQQQQQARRKLASSSADCEAECKDPPFKDLEYFEGEDMMSPANMLERLKTKRQEWVTTRLYKDYGKDNYNNIFEPLDEETKERASVGRRIFADAATLHKSKSRLEEEISEEGPAWSRFVRKLKMKILQIRLGMLEERKNAKPICLDDCSQEDEEDERRRRQLKGNKPTQLSNGLYSKLVWATGGHSASAGHGNLFRESYTANMDRALTPLLASIGVEFEARNYAMGGTDSAEEVSLCYHSIFGRDVDIMSWDYGMTDGHELWKMTMYAYKAAGVSKITDAGSMPGNIRHRPAFFAIHQNVANNLVVESMQQVGMTALAYNRDFMDEVVLAAVPDMFGKSDKGIANTPKYLQYLKCEGRIEAGEPGCLDNKWNNTLCTQRKARTSWHPGWKMHALNGNLMAMTILDAVEDALQELVEWEEDIGAEEPEDTKKRLSKLLQGLDKEEKKDYDNIFTSPIPEPLMPHLEKFLSGGRAELMKDVDIEAFLKETSFCHTAILPSQIRFQGFLTENFTLTGDIMDQNYDEGVSRDAIRKVENPGKNKDGSPYNTDGKMMLTKDDSGRQVCEEYLNLDYKDFFFVSSLEGWQTLTIPNESSKKVFKEFDATKAKGYVLACLTTCDWGNCPAGDMKSHFGALPPRLARGAKPPTEEEIARLGKVEIMVNGVKVVEASDMHHCYALKHRRGHVWEPNDDGTYEIKVRIKDATDYTYVRFSSFIVL